MTFSHIEIREKRIGQDGMYYPNSLFPKHLAL